MFFSLSHPPTTNPNPWTSPTTKTQLNHTYEYHPQPPKITTTSTTSVTNPPPPRKNTAKTQPNQAHEHHSQPPTLTTTTLVTNPPPPKEEEKKKATTIPMPTAKTQTHSQTHGQNPSLREPQLMNQSKHPHSSNPPPRRQAPTTSLSSSTSNTGHNK